MKKIVLIVLMCIGFTNLHAQVPQGIPYQSVLRNSAGNLIANQNVSLRFSVHDSSAGGTIVYQETHATATNNLGLAVVTVGQGNPLIGTFSTISWGEHAKFMQVEMDTAGNTNYTDMGTQQMMSVPYALYANSTGNGVNNGTATNQILYWNGSAWVTLNPGSNGQSLTMCNGVLTWANGGLCPPILTSLDCAAAIVTGDLFSGLEASNVSVSVPYTGVDGGTYLAQAISSTGVTGITATLSQGSVSNGSGSLLFSITGVPSTTGTASFAISIGGQNCFISINVTTIYIGASFQGGIVAYILQSGDPDYDANIPRGLIAAPSDQSTGAQWGCSGTIIAGASGTAIGTGNQNTIDIETGCTTSGTAADICAHLVLNGYSDWFLPSINELIKLYLNRVAIGGFNNALYYWSSSQYMSYNNGSETAWGCHFFNGGGASIGKSQTHRVRAIRTF